MKKIFILLFILGTVATVVWAANYVTLTDTNGIVGSGTNPMAVTITNVSINWTSIDADTKDAILAAMDWSSLDGAEIQSAAINWPSATTAVQTANINWTSIPTFTGDVVGNADTATIAGTVTTIEASRIQNSNINWTNIVQGIQTASINWDDVKNSEIQNVGINWTDSTATNVSTIGTEQIVSSNINWTTVKDDAAINWADMTGL